MEKWKDRKFRLLLYPEDPTHSAAMKELQESGYQFMAILHTEDVWTEDDEDLGNHKPGDKKKEHWHVVLKFPQPKWSTGLAKDLKIKENYIKKCKSFERAALYIIHYGWPDKHQYPLEQVFGPLQPQLKKLLASDDEGVRVKKIIQILDDLPGKITARKALIAVSDEGLYGEFRRMGIFAKMLIEEHNAEIVECERIVQMRQTEFDEFREYIKWRERSRSAGYDIIT